MSYNENVISYIQFLEKNIKAGATDKITTLGQELLTKFHNKELNPTKLQAFFEAE